MSNFLKKWRLALAILAGISLAMALFLTLSLAVSPRTVQAHPDLPAAWTAAEPVPNKTTNYAFAKCVDDPDGFYIIGGGQAQGDPIDFVWHYNASSDTWTALETLPVALIAPTATCYEGKIYVAGGWSLEEPHITRNFFIYDIASDTWAQGTNLPHVLWLATMGAWDGKLYLVGGTMIDYPFTPVNHVDIYDITESTWMDQAGTAMPSAASSPGYAQVGQYLFIVGGCSGNTSNNVNATQRYDMAVDAWDNGPTFVSARDAIGLAATSSHLYAMGGDADGGSWDDLTDLVEALNYTDWSGSSWSDLGDPLQDTYGGNMGGLCTEAITGGEIWSVAGAIDSETITNTNYYRHAEPCADFYFGNLAPENLDDTGAPGEDVSYTLSINNNGTLADTYDITSSASWTTTHPATIGPLEPGESAEFVVEVTVLAGASPTEQDLATITVTSQGDPSQSDRAALSTTAQVTYGVDCEADSTALSGFQGRMVNYTLTVTNEGNTTDTFDLDTGGNAWMTDLSQTQVTLDTGESTQVVVSVTIPEDAVAGAADTVAVTLTSQGDPGTTDTASLTTTALSTLTIYIPWVEKN